ncbi:hypothetical protein [Streptomyces sp. NPDC004330]|uniref:hypothetical protein n=1 Tax=Streptomyces sp. NPDC004330 TaxID=3364700 RepID=UPI00368C3921
MADETTTSDVTEEPGSATGTEQRTDDAPDLGEAGQKALAAERKARSAAERQAKTQQRQLDDLTKRLKEYEDRDKSDADKLTERATTAEQRATAAERELLRYRVARDKKVPAEWVDRLRGENQEALEEDADRLLSALGDQQLQRTPDYDGGVRRTAQPSDMNSLIRRAAGRG